MKWELEDYLIWGFFALVLGVIAFGAVALYQDSKRPTFELKKGDWICSAQRTEYHTVMIPSGKVLVPIVQTTEVCDQWSRR